MRYIPTRGSGKYIPITTSGSAGLFVTIEFMDMIFVFTENKKCKWLFQMSISWQKMF